jgi:peptide/nickel transport system permease protein
MTTYIASRLVQAVFILLLVTLIVFLAVHFLPGDPILMLMSREAFEQATLQEIELIRHEYGLDKPVIIQYLDWIGDMLRGDFGQSIVQNVPVLRLIIGRLGITMHLSLLAMVISIFIGMPAGVICAVRRATWLDTVLTVVSNIGITIPVFWLAAMMVYVFGLELKWLPTHGYTSPFENFWLSTKQVILPVLCLTIYPVASHVRFCRSSMLEVMQQDYIRTAWSKGLGEIIIIIRHALKNGLIPIVTLFGVGFRNVVGGSVLVETVFNIPGMGRMGVTAMLGHDYPLIQGFVVLITVVVIFSNLAVDLSYGWLDPRIRYE